MSEVTKQDLLDLEARMDGRARQNLVDMENRIIGAILGEMGIRFGEVNQRLDRMDATLQLHGKQIAAGTKAIAGFTAWAEKADGDYTRVLAELADLKIRMGKLEAKP